MLWDRPELGPPSNDSDLAKLFWDVLKVLSYLRALLISRLTKLTLDNRDQYFFGSANFVANERVLLSI